MKREKGSPLVNAGSSSSGCPRPDKLRALRAAYQKALKRLRGRAERGRSIRSIARQVKISHPTLISILNAPPEKAVSKLTMLKVIRAVRGRKRNPVFRANLRYLWNVDAI